MVLQCVLVASAILSDPLAALLISPLVLVRLLSLRPFWSRAQAVTWAFVGASVVQGIASIIATFVERTRIPSSSRPSAPEFAEAYSGRVVVDSLVGVSGTTNVVAVLGAWGLVLGVVVAAAIVSAVAWRDPARRWLVLAFALASIGFSVVVFVLKWDGLAGVPAGAVAPGGRYMVVPILLLVSAYAIAADHFATTLAPRRLAWVPIALFAALVIVPGVVDYRVVDPRADSQPWEVSLETAAAACAADPSLTVGPAPISPTWFTPAFVPCDLLTTP
jgi:hypothetical protein